MFIQHRYSAVIFLSRVWPCLIDLAIVFSRFRQPQLFVCPCGRRLVPRTKTLASIEEYPQESRAKKLADDFLRGINETRGSKPQASLTLGEFIEQGYFSRP